MGLRGNRKVPLFGFGDIPIESHIILYISMFSGCELVLFGEDKWERSHTEFL
jgi:hypothetical protein